MNMLKREMYLSLASYKFLITSQLKLDDAPTMSLFIDPTQLLLRMSSLKSS